MRILTQRQQRASGLSTEETTADATVAADEIAPYLSPGSPFEVSASVRQGKIAYVLSPKETCLDARLENEEARLAGAVAAQRHLKLKAVMNSALCDIQGCSGVLKSIGVT